MFKKNVSQYLEQMHQQVCRKMLQIDSENKLTLREKNYE